MTEFRDDFSARPFDLVLDVSVQSQSPSTNKSVLACTLKIVRTGAYQSFASSGSTWSESIDGNAAGPTAFAFDFRNYNSLTLATWTVEVTHGSDGNKTVAVSASATASVIGSAAISSSLVLPQIIQPPTAPSSVVATRASDTLINVGWTRNPASGKPYDGQSLYVAVDGAAPVLVANVAGTATSQPYTAAANHKYVFTVVASNSAGSTTSAASNTILTTPAALATLAGAVVTAGTIRLTLPVRPTPYTEAQVVITESHNAGVTWNAKTTLAMSALSASTTTTWDDTAAQTSGTVQYKAVVQTTGGTQGTLSAAAKLSNELVLNTPPGAPTEVTPAGAVDASHAIRIGWTHNASGDGAAQSSRKIEYSANGGSTWTSIVAGNSTIGFYDWTPTLGSFTAGQTVLIRVATAGSQPGTYGAWSASQALIFYGSLAAVLVTNFPPAVHAGGPLPIHWTSSPTWGTATQARYQVTVTDQASGQVVFDTGLVASTDQAVDVPSSVQIDGHIYTVILTLLDNHQITSQPVSQSVTMDYLMPGPVDVTWFYDDATGSLTFYPTFDPETSSPFDDTASWTLERSLDGTTWAEVGSQIGPVPIADNLVRVGVASTYRTVAYSTLGVAGEPTPFTIPAADVRSRWGWINFGGLFQSRIRFGWTLNVDIQTGRVSDAFEVEGAEYAVPVFGLGLQDSRTFTGKLLYGDRMPANLATSSPDDVMTMSKEAETCVFRDPEGSWFTARVFDLKLSPLPKKDGPDEARFSLTVERVAA